MSLLGHADDAAAMQRLAFALVDRYRIERALGAGGMATVYLAHDIRHDRPVAIKVLHPEVAESLGRERFLREIRLAAKLTHPHILPLHDSGEGAGFLYFVMPVMEGQTLRDRTAVFRCFSDTLGEARSSKSPIAVSMKPLPL